MKTNAALCQIVSDLQAHVEQMLREQPQADEQQAIHNFLACQDLVPTEHCGILDGYRRRKLQQLPRPAIS